MAKKFQVQVRGAFGGTDGGWRPAMCGTLNQTTKSDAEASTVETVEDAQILVELAEAEHAEEIRIHPLD